VRYERGRRPARALRHAQTKKVSARKAGTADCFTNAAGRDDAPVHTTPRYARRSTADAAAGATVARTRRSK